MSFKISAITIKGFRKIQEPLTLDWTAPNGLPLNQVIIAGPNGWGKTSLLEAIVLGLGQGDLLVRDVPASDRKNHWRLKVPEGAEIRLTLQINKPHDDFFEKDFFEKDLLVNGSIDVICTHDGIHNGTPIKGGRWSDFKKILQFIFKQPGFQVEYFSSRRTPALVGSLKPTMAGTKSKDQDNEANRLRQFKQLIIDQRSRRAFRPEQENTDEIWLKKLNAAWAKFHGDDGSYIDADIVDPDSEDTLFDLFIFDAPRIRRCALDQVSSGELELITIFGTLIQKNFSGILIIDEPELHMHPQWQAGLLRALRKVIPDSQIIMATHADAPWDQAMSFERFFLSSPSDSRYNVGAKQDIKESGQTLSWDDE